MRDPVDTNPQHYSVTFENAHVRVLEYLDAPGDETTPHDHPDSVMYTLSSFRRRLQADDHHVEVALTAGTTAWLPAQRHAGHNIGDTPTHVIFVELKHSAGHNSDNPVGPELAPHAPEPHDQQDSDQAAAAETSPTPP